MSPKSYWITNGSDYEVIRGYKKEGKKLPDERKWRPGKEYGSWVPRRNTPEGRKLAKEFDALPKWDCKDVEEAVGYKVMFDGGYAYFFNPFWYSSGYYGFRIPLFEAADYKRKKELTYKPVKGVKEVSWKTHTKKTVMTKREYQQSLPASSFATSAVKTTRSKGLLPKHRKSTATSLSAT